MNIVYILGNGFDKAFGLPTSYPEFYDYYLKRPSENVHIEKMKEHLKSHMFDTWADMEIGLGQYTEQVQSQEELEMDYHSITDSIKSYLLDVTSKFSPEASIASEFFFSVYFSFEFFTARSET